MQAVQAAIIAAAAEQHRQQLGRANHQKQQQDGSPDAAPPPAAATETPAADSAGLSTALDRTERLANSLGKMAATVEQLNAIPNHAFSIMLMAGG
jgi:hypothetical protein